MSAELDNEYVELPTIRISRELMTQWKEHGIPDEGKECLASLINAAILLWPERGITLTAQINDYSEQPLVT